MFAYRLQVQGYNLSASPLTIFFCRSGLQFFIAFSLSSFHVFITEINHVHPQYVVSTDKTSTCRGNWWTPLAILPVNDSGITKSPRSAMGAGYLLEKPPERKLEEVRNRSSCMWENHWRYGWYRPINWSTSCLTWTLLSSWGRTFVTPIQMRAWGGPMNLAYLVERTPKTTPSGKESAGGVDFAQFKDRLKRFTRKVY